MYYGLVSVRQRIVNKHYSSYIGKKVNGNSIAIN
jgi:hypothetical protein